MIIVDTNVISELMTAAPSPVVMRWFAARPPDGIYTTAITQAEIIRGIRLLPEGKRRSGLDAAVLMIFSANFADRVLAFDSAASVIFADVSVLRTRVGRPISYPDAQIAAISLSHGAVLATRNVKDFEGIGLSIVDPWIEAAPTPTASPASRTPRRP